eukprot:3252594-Rhodomonas_salina.3
MELLAGSVTDALLSGRVAGRVAREGETADAWSTRACCEDDDACKTLPCDANEGVYVEEERTLASARGDSSTFASSGGST